MLRECPVVLPKGMATDYDLSLQTAREKVRADCNARQLQAIKEAMENAPAQ